MDWLEKAIKTVKGALGFKDTAQPTEKCPLKKTGLIVVVLRRDTRRPIEGARVNLTGPANQSKPTDRDGIAQFRMLVPANYTIRVALPQGIKDDFLPVEPEMESVTEGNCPVHIVHVSPISNVVTPDVFVNRQEARCKFKEIASEKEAHVFLPENKETKDEGDVVAIKLTYKETRPNNAYDKGGILHCRGARLWRDQNCQTPLTAPDGKLAIRNGDLKTGYTCYARWDEPGDADLTLELEATRKECITVEAPVSKTVKIKAKNRVTPCIKVEHLVVLRDQKLSDEQRKNDTYAGSAKAEAADLIYADATRIELGLQQSAAEPAYTGKGKLTFSPKNVKVFEDEACEKAFDVDKPIEAATLTGKEPFKLWLRGETAGKFHAELKLDPSDNPLIKVDDPAKGEMGCVELKLKLFHYKKDDVNKAVNPDVDNATTYWNELKGLTLEQAEMTKAERIGTGRMLHVQKDNNHSRAKMIVEKVNGDHWPAAAKDYQVVVDLADADKKQKKHSGELKLFTAEAEGAEKALPHQIPIATVKGAEQTLWVEGSGACTGWRGRRISLGFDRPEGGLAKTSKLDGDWGTFTVIKIKEVKCDVANEAGQEKFIDGSKIFINLDDQGRVLKSVGGKRKAEVTAEIEPALKDVDLHFAVVEHADNYKISTIPADFKETKLSKLKHTLKPVDKDDRKKLLHVSAKTDDRGKAKIETLQTPQLALQKFKIGAYILQDVQQARYVDEHADLKKRAPVMSSTWLEIWQRLFYRVAAMKRWSGASYLDRFDGTALETKLADVGILLERTADPVTTNFEAAPANFLTWARNALGTPAPARTMYFGLISGRGDKGDSEKTINLGAPTFKNPAWTLGFHRFRSMNKADWLVSCEVAYDGTTHNLSATSTLTQTEDFKFSLAIDVSALWTNYKNTVNEAKANHFLANGAITLKIKQAESSSGVSWHEAVVVCMDTREPNHATQDAKDSASHTFFHEIGHYVGLAAKFLPDAADTQNPNFYSEIAGETSARGRGGYGLGPHCDGLSDDCMMWYQFKMTLEYCDMCNLFLRARHLHSPKVNGRSKL